MTCHVHRERVATVLLEWHVMPTPPAMRMISSSTVDRAWSTLVLVVNIPVQLDWMRSAPPVLLAMELKHVRIGRNQLVHPRSQMGRSTVDTPTNTHRRCVVPPVRMDGAMNVPLGWTAIQVRHVRIQVRSTAACRGIMPHQVVNSPVQVAKTMIVPPERTATSTHRAIRMIHSCAGLTLRMQVQAVIDPVRREIRQIALWACHVLHIRHVPVDLMEMMVIALLTTQVAIVLIPKAIVPIPKSHHRRPQSLLLTYPETPISVVHHSSRHPRSVLIRVHHEWTLNVRRVSSATVARHVLPERHTTAVRIYMRPLQCVNILAHRGVAVNAQKVQAALDSQPVRIRVHFFVEITLWMRWGHVIYHARQACRVTVLQLLLVLHIRPVTRKILSQ